MTRIHLDYITPTILIDKKILPQIYPDFQSRPCPYLAGIIRNDKKKFDEGFVLNKES